ncbi:MAG: hypothetical protein AAF809_11240 [Bacteroidota bacterium]
MPLATPISPSKTAPVETARVRIYTYPDCPDTERIVAFLDAQAVAYALDDLEGLPSDGDCGFVSPTIEIGRDVLVRPDCGDLERLLRSHGLITGRPTMPSGAAASACPTRKAA